MKLSASTSLLFSKLALVMLAVLKPAAEFAKEL
jgi:hypothetical protein